MSGKFSSDAARRAFEELSESATGHDTLSLLEACATLLSQIIARGSYDLPSAQLTARTCGEAMAGDIAHNWRVVIAARKASCQ